MARFLFLTRWLQLPLYLGLVLAQCVYVYHFWVELVDLIGAVLGNQQALQHIMDSVAVENSTHKPHKLGETAIMLVVLGLIDVVMISNLLIMVIIGGYETFVSRMNLEGHPDQPEWLSHVNASVLKVKLATAIIGISSIHLLKTFINATLPFYFLRYRLLIAIDCYRIIRKIITTDEYIQRKTLTYFFFHSKM